ncbi:MAG: LysM peptidoglycan-binding domain-containing M23 family metallopeptidase [Candidatus Paceibacterota bacterium]
MKTSYFWLAVILISFLLFDFLALGAFKNHSPYQEKYWSSGGPVSSENMEEASNAFLGSSMTKAVRDSDVSKNILLKESASAVGSSHPFSNVIPSRDGLNKYKVREGDTLSGIAAGFGISLETIKLANTDVSSSLIPGEEITILPVSGILYEIEENDTLEGVASTYTVDVNLIKEYNKNYQELFSSSGSVIVLPYAKPLNRWAYINKHSNSLPNLNNYFQLPAKGWNWGSLHYSNAVDIAAACGEEIYAAQEGLVIEASSNDYWNDGYGNYILIEHPNETKTKYAHTLKNFIEEGDYVLQGDTIALIGNTGNVHGPTGCHLHFEVYGAKNPFAVK